MMDDRPSVEIERVVRTAREDPGGVPLESLVESLEHPAPSTRERAATALYTVSKTHPERVLEVIPTLVPLLESDRAMHRNKILMTMANVGEEYPAELVSHTAAVLELLDDESALVCQSSVHVLSHVATVDPAAVAPAVSRVIPSLNSELDPTRLHAIALLEAVVGEHPEAAIDAVEPILDVLEAPYELPDISYDPTQTSIGADPTDQMQGYRFLVTDQSARSSNVRVRERAATMLATATTDQPATMVDAVVAHLPRLVGLSSDRNAIIRSAITTVFAHVGEENPTAITPIEDDLVGVLEEPRHVSETTVWALRCLGTERALEALREVAVSDAVDAPVRAAAERALVELEF